MIYRYFYFTYNIPKKTIKLKYISHFIIKLYDF